MPIMARADGESARGVDTTRRDPSCIQLTDDPQLGLGVAHVLDEVDHHDRVELHAGEGLVRGDARVEHDVGERALARSSIASALRSMP